MIFAPDSRGKMRQMHAILAVAQAVKRPYSRVYNDLTAGRLKAERVEGRWFVADTELQRYRRDIDRLAPLGSPDRFRAMA